MFFFINAIGPAGIVLIPWYGTIRGVKHSKNHVSMSLLKKSRNKFLKNQKVKSKSKIKKISYAFFSNALPLGTIVEVIGEHKISIHYFNIFFLLFQNRW